MLKRLTLMFVGCACLIAVFAVTLFNTNIQLAQGATLPADFTDTLVTSVPSAIALDFTSDGRMLITTQSGQLRVYQNGALLTTPALDFSSRICNNSERGMLGVTADPDFSANHYIYIYYTFNKFNSCANNSSTSPVNRLARFVLPDSNVIDPATETILIDNLPSPGGNHNGGDLHFGKDGFLYISVGDGGCRYDNAGKCAGGNDAARERHHLLGKVLRITKTGGIPAGNPYQGTGTARCNTGMTSPGTICQEIFAWGLRNPFRLAFDSNSSTTRFFINDVGQNVWEEIDEGQIGADYGWNVREGKCKNGSRTDCPAPPAGMTDPIYAYPHENNCVSITGGAFVPNGLWPASYDGAYLYNEYGCGKIYKLTKSGNTYTASEFVTNLSLSVHLMFGPYNGSQALYYTTFVGGGQIRRITYTGNANRPPTAALSVSPRAGNAPLSVTLNGSASSDPDAGNTLTWLWDFGDGSSQVVTGSAVLNYTYTNPGVYTATLRVRDNLGAISAPVTARIDVGNTAPVPVISSPTTTTQYAVGQTITLQGSASDEQDGALPGSALSWRVILHHNDHTHPFLAPTTGASVNITAPAPEDLAATETSYLEIELTATDSTGLSTVITRAIYPKKVNVTFATQPDGLQLQVNDQTITAPKTLVSWENYLLNVTAFSQVKNNVAYDFASWSDGKAASHVITTPASSATYTATFVVNNSAGTGLTGAYFNNKTLSGAALTRTDTTVDFNWGATAPLSGIGVDNFSVRWSGEIKPEFSETYTFYTFSDDGVRVWVNGQQVINNWTDHSATENSGTLGLVGGQKYSIVMEFYENGGDAVARLLWSSASQARQVIPTARLYPTVTNPPFSGAKINFQPADAPVPSGYLADSGAVYSDRGNGQTYGWNVDNSAQTRDRNASNSPDQRYDTVIHLQKPENPNAVWEIAVPNGTYSVKLVSGDAGYYDGSFKLNVEGVLAINGTPTSATRWLENTVMVSVTDGKLTISNASGAVNNKLCFVDITRQS